MVSLTELSTPHPPSSKEYNNLKEFRDIAIPQPLYNVFSQSKINVVNERGSFTKRLQLPNVQKTITFVTNRRFKCHSGEENGQSWKHRTV